MVLLARGTCRQSVGPFAYGQLLQITCCLQKMDFYCVLPLAFLHIAHMSVLLFLLSVSSQRQQVGLPTFYGLNDPAPTSAPSKKIPLWDFPQGPVSLVSPFFFFPPVPSFGSYYYFPSLLLFSSSPSWRFIFFSPHLIPSFS